MNEFHWALEHFSEHTTSHICHPVQSCLSCHVMSCEASARMFYEVVIDAESMLADTRLVTVAPSRWEMQWRSSSCWCGWRRLCPGGRRLRWLLQRMSMNAAGECSERYSICWTGNQEIYHTVKWKWKASKTLIFIYLTKMWLSSDYDTVIMITLHLTVGFQSLYECHYSKQKDNRGPSFETISASGPNAALAHYR